MAWFKSLSYLQRTIKNLRVEHLKLSYLLFSIKKVCIVECLDELGIILFLQHSTRLKLLSEILNFTDMFGNMDFNIQAYQNPDTLVF